MCVISCLYLASSISRVEKSVADGKRKLEHRMEITHSHVTAVAVPWNGIGCCFLTAQSSTALIILIM